MLSFLPMESADREGTQGPSRVKSAFFRAAGFFFVFSVACLAACAAPYSRYIGGDAKTRTELNDLFSLLEAPELSEEERFAVVQQVCAAYVRSGDRGRLIDFLAARVEARPDDPYLAYHLLTIAYAYAESDQLPIARLYFDRIVRSCPDLIVMGESLHRICLSRLVDIETDPERRIAYLTDLTTRFAESVDMGALLFYLAKNYEKIGEWPLAIRTYRQFLPYARQDVPGFPDALRYARTVIDFQSSAKDWIYPNLDSLVADIKRALDNNNTRQLEAIRAKVGFFAITWQQAEREGLRSSLDLPAFMTDMPIKYEGSLDPISGPREAYLKTTGWAGRMSTWYLYLRMIDFPANPDIHGRWEWAGVFMGDKQ